MSETTYALGHSSAEIQRLKDQAAMLRPITERLLRSAGIDAGMRVLDLGYGVKLFSNKMEPIRNLIGSIRDRLT